MFFIIAAIAVFYILVALIHKRKARFWYTTRWFNQGFLWGTGLYVLVLVVFPYIFGNNPAALFGWEGTSSNFNAFVNFLVFGAIALLLSGLPAIRVRRRLSYMLGAAMGIPLMGFYMVVVLQFYFRVFWKIG